MRWDRGILMAQVAPQFTIAKLVQMTRLPMVDRRYRQIDRLDQIRLEQKIDRIHVYVYNMYIYI